MDFKIQTEHVNLSEYNKEHVDAASKFSKRIMKEMGQYIKAIILFGSTTRKKKNPHDIDILIILDDVTLKITNEFTEAYKVICNRVILDVNPKIHLSTLRLTNFWEYVRVGDPIAINMLRSGVALYDTGFFDPVRMLLRKGQIKPSKESMWNYYSRAPITIENSRWHVSQAVVDLYWAVVDASHAALMRVGEIPPSPDHVAKMLDEKLVAKRHLEKKYVHTMDKFYKLSKQIMHREIKHISGTEYDKLLKEAQEFLERMKRVIG